MKFSERLGINPVEKAVQRESMDDALRNTLWSLLSGFYWDKFDKPRSDSTGYSRLDYINRSNLGPLFQSLWLHFFKQPLDTIPSKFYDRNGGYEHLRKFFFEAEWYEVYDFVEFVKDNALENQSDKFEKTCNLYLERETAAYRFIDGKLVEITAAEEIDEIENALADSVPYYGVREHISSALQLLSDRESPDYRNSIKESISAVESLCNAIDEEKSSALGAALSLLEKRGLLHPALKKGFSAIYGYTSNANGIRHGLIDGDREVTSAEARFMVVSCSAFINYVISVIADDA